MLYILFCMATQSNAHAFEVSLYIYILAFNLYGRTYKCVLLFFFYCFYSQTYIPKLSFYLHCVININVIVSVWCLRFWICGVKVYYIFCSTA